MYSLCYYLDHSIDGDVLYLKYYPYLCYVN